MTEAVVVRADQPKEEQKKVTEAPVREEKVRLRAYELYLERNSEPGTPEDDWFRAEKEIADSPTKQVSR